MTFRVVFPGAARTRTTLRSAPCWASGSRALASAPGRFGTSVRQRPICLILIPMCDGAIGQPNVLGVRLTALGDNRAAFGCRRILGGGVVRNRSAFFLFTARAGSCDGGRRRTVQYRGHHRLPDAVIIIPVAERSQASVPLGLLDYGPLSEFLQNRGWVTWHRYQTG